MTNLDSMSLSKVPYHMRPVSNGYSHSVQMYLVLEKNINNLMCFNKKNITMRFWKKKKIQNPAFNHITVKKNKNVRVYLNYKKASLTFQTMANSHVLTHTVLSPRPYFKGLVDFKKVDLEKSIRGAKVNSRMLKLVKYKKIILNDCKKNFLNYTWWKKKIILYITMYLTIIT